MMVEIDGTELPLEKQKKRGFGNESCIQSIFQPHVKCNDTCQQFFYMYKGKMRFFMKEKYDYDLDIDLNLAIEKIRNMIKNQKALKTKRRRIMKKKFIPFSNSLTHKFLIIAEQFTCNSIKPQYLAASLHISLERAKYLQKLIVTQQHLEKSKNLFCFKEEHEIWLYQFVNSNNTQYLYNQRELFREFQERFNQMHLQISFSLFSRWIKKLKILSYRQFSQVSFQSQTRSVKERRFEFAKQLVALIDQNVPIIYIDECSFGRNIKVARCWQIRKRFKLTQITPSSKKSKSVIGAISNTGFSAFKCLIGSVNSVVFAEFLHELFQLLKQAMPDNNFVLILDNATYHKSSIVANILQLVNYLYLPPYTPQFNCIEKFWSLAKHKVAQVQYSTNLAELVQLHNVFSNFEPITLKNICLSNHEYLLAALLLQNF